MSAKLRKQALQLLAKQPLTLRELAEKIELKEEIVGKREKRAFKVLRSLFEKGLVNCFTDENKQRRYRSVETTV